MPTGIPKNGINKGWFKKGITHELSVETRRKIGLAHRGLIMSPKSRKKMSVAKKGKYCKENHPNWAGDSIDKICPICKKYFTVRPCRFKIQKYCSRRCYEISHTGFKHSIKTRKLMVKNAARISGEKHWCWEGGAMKARGYVLIYAPQHPFGKNRYILEHRLVVESIIERILNPTEVVHHINKKRDDNRPKNLIAFINNSVHQRFERGKKINLNEIIFDGRHFIE